MWLCYQQEELDRAKGAPNQLWYSTKTANIFLTKLKGKKTMNNAIMYMCVYMCMCVCVCARVVFLLCLLVAPDTFLAVRNKDVFSPLDATVHCRNGPDRMAPQSAVRQRLINHK